MDTTHGGGLREMRKCMLALAAVVSAMIATDEIRARCATGELQ
jgi:hypothetical protein